MVLAAGAGAWIGRRIRSVVAARVCRGGCPTAATRAGCGSGSGPPAAGSAVAAGGRRLAATPLRRDFAAVAVVFRAGAAAWAGRLLPEAFAAAQQLFHHPQRLFAEPLDRPGPVQGEGGAHRQATAALGASQRCGQLRSQPRCLSIQLLLEAQIRMPGPAAQVLQQAAQAAGGAQPQVVPAGMAG